MLIFNRSDASTYSGIISGTGPLAKEGAGTLTFSGANTYTGATSVEAGTLIVSGSIANSATTIALGATLQIGNGGTSGSLTGGITNYGSLVFDRTNASTYSGLISSVGTLTKRGAGTLTLSGLNTYTGSTQVEGGTLIVNGSIAGSAATVASGATLGGSGAMGSVTVNSGGFFAPGNSIGANNMLSLDLKSGAIFAVEINNGGFVAGTNNDHATVSSLATIESGAIIAVSSYPAGQDGSTYTPGRYTILDAGVGLTVLGGVTIDEHFAFLDFTYGFDAFSLWLDSVLATPSLCLAGSSDNECATGKGVSSLGSGNPLYSQLLGMTDAQALAAQNALSGEVHASAQSVFIQSAGLIRNAALARLRESFDQYGGNDTVILGYAEQAAAPYKRHPAMWAQMFGAAGEIDGNDNAADLDSHEYGVLGGVDGFVFDDWRLGLLAGYSRTDFDVDDGRASNGDSDNVHLGVYGGTEFGSLGLRFGLAHTWHKIDTKREALGQTLKADYDARTFQAFTEIGYRFDHQTFWFEPFAGLAYVRHHTEAFSESGGSAALDVEAETSDTGFTTLGARAAVDVMLGQVATTLRGSAGWRHAFGDTVPESVNAFSGGDSFTVSGTPIARNAAVLEAGLDLHASEMAVITLTYAGQFASDAHEHTGHVKAIIAF